jgi:hypothetical protein
MYHKAELKNQDVVKDVFPIGIKPRWMLGVSLRRVKDCLTYNCTCMHSPDSSLLCTTLFRRLYLIERCGTL